MTTDNFENQRPQESTENFDSTSSSALSDSLNNDLYKDLSLFNKSASGVSLPGLEIAGLGNESAVMAMRSSDKQPQSKAETDTPASRDAALTGSGMQRVPAEDYGNADVYKPADGKTDKHGRSQVELIHDGGQLQYEISKYPDGRQVTKEYGNDGNVASIQTRNPDGTATTRYPGIKGDSDTMKSAFEKDGAEGLKKEIESVLKQSNGDWNKVNKMIEELKGKGVDIYEQGGNIKVNDQYPWATDSTIATRPATSAPAPEAPKEPAPPASQGGSGYHPAAQGFVPSWWTKSVDNGLKGKAN